MFAGAGAGAGAGATTAAPAAAEEEKQAPWQIHLLHLFAYRTYFPTKDLLETPMGWDDPLIETLNKILNARAAGTFFSSGPQITFSPPTTGAAPNPGHYTLQVAPQDNTFTISCCFNCAPINVAVPSRQAVPLKKQSDVLLTVFESKAKEADGFFGLKKGIEILEKDPVLQALITRIRRCLHKEKRPFLTVPPVEELAQYIAGLYLSPSGDAVEKAEEADKLLFIYLESNKDGDALSNLQTSVQDSKIINHHLDLFPWLFIFLPTESHQKQGAYLTSLLRQRSYT